MQYEVAGKQLKCPHCNETNFKRSEAQLNTAMLTLFDLDFLNESADTFFCTNCGRIEWFLPSAITKREINCKKPASEAKWINDTSEASDCLSCGGTIPAGKSNCPNCNWSYNS